MNILFIAPHPDDIEFACFGTLLKHKAKGDNIIYLVVSECSNLHRNKNLPQETRKVMKIIQPTKEIRLNLPNTRIYDTENREILRKNLEGLQFHIDKVYSPWIKDINQDHHATAEEAIRVFRYKTIIQYEITHSCPMFNPNCYEKITEKQMRIKLETINIFKSQAKKRYATSTFVKNLMVYRGQEVGFKYAEAFIIWRLIIE